MNLNDPDPYIVQGVDTRTAPCALGACQAQPGQLCRNSVDGSPGREHPHWSRVSHALNTAAGAEPPLEGFLRGTGGV